MYSDNCHDAIKFNDATLMHFKTRLDALAEVHEIITMERTAIFV